MQTWITTSPEDDFSIYNLPYGIFSTAGGRRRIGVAIGKQIIDLKKAYEADVFAGIGITADVLEREVLNPFIAMGKSVTNMVRNRLQEELCEVGSKLHSIRSSFVNMEDVIMHMPIEVGDYTDFYSSIEHATNVGVLFRDPDNALLPNWRHLPVAYHGRASSIVESGVPIHRPNGQTKPGDGDPIYGPSKLLDFELEVAFIIGKNTALGSSVSTSEAEDYIFGMVLFNDWSARDIQKWEYVPLGPFLAKNFGSSISPWVVTMEALEYFKVEGPSQEPAVLDYLIYEGKKNYDINLEVYLQPEGYNESLISSSNYKYMYWNQCQQLAHHTVNGCNINVGDVMASGTISGKDESSYGSLLEITKGGKNTIQLGEGIERKFIMDKDTVVMKGYAERGGRRVGFGEVRTQILPPRND